MAVSAALVDIARDLARVSRCLAEALENGEFDAAEHFVMARALLLDAAAEAPWPTEAAEIQALVEARTVVTDCAQRSEAAVRRSLGAVHGALGDLTTGARAMSAYLAGGSLAPGWVDRRD